MQAESERKEIEIDQALQDRDNAVRELETNIEIVRTELDKTKAERDELGWCFFFVFVYHEKQ